MRKFKVIALSVGGRAKKIFNSGDTVFENNFSNGALPGLISGGFLQEIEPDDDDKKQAEAELLKQQQEDEAKKQREEEEELLKEKEEQEALEKKRKEEDREELEKQESLKSSTDAQVNNQEGGLLDSLKKASGANDSNVDDELSIDDYDVKEIKKFLSNLEVKFDKNASKEELFELFKTEMKK